VAVLAGVAASVAALPGALTPGPAASAAPGAGGSGAPDRASTSTRGIVGRTIDVVFPVVSLNSLSGKLGFAEDAEFGEQKKAIRLFVSQVNDHGGINGRRIHPIIVTFTPTNTAEMRALCKDWTEGSPAAFAVLDGEGTWSETNQLCITQEGHTPLLSQWTTVTDWTEKGAPYLWWTGPDDAPVLQAVVDVGLGSGLLGDGRQVGVIAGNRASDQLALKRYLLPDLARAGVKPVVETIAADPTATATTNADAPLVVQKLKSAGVTSVIPLIPFNVFFPILQAQTQQKYFPKLLLSDYESSIESSLGLIPVPYQTALNGQLGVTTETLGGIDDTRPESEGGYDAGVRSCWTVWHRAYPEIPPGNQNDFIEEQGPVQGWCQEIRLFTAAARAAGPDLNRRTFVEAMSHITKFDAGYAPTFTYGPGKFYGPTEYRVVRLHTNQPPSAQCPMPKDKIAEIQCWVVVQTWKPLPSTG
jgi:hypothetical protein